MKLLSKRIDYGKGKHIKEEKGPCGRSNFKLHV